ncbi:hypothetical protein FHX72_000720 [Pseudoclavibacter helvolus]|uniref:Uncharacterized protein n=1 Tax=Pseudoclavibacter helvolus TaxID=255205 RepID=A0A7W4ULX0_9MICO|nr:hypothetical protein [Pseudoclavibacter helvolus]
MTSSPTHPTGQLKHYRDVTGRKQTGLPRCFRTVPSLNAMTFMLPT